LAVTRWREDGTTDAWGSFCYLRDAETGRFWSSTPQPMQWQSDAFEAVFSEGRAEFRSRDHGIDAYTEVVVSPEDDIELRRLRLTNRGRTRRRIEITTYTEIVIAPAAADASHPAFSKLFVQTEVLEQPDADPRHAAPARGRRACAMGVPSRRRCTGQQPGRCLTRQTVHASSAAAAACMRRRPCKRRGPLSGTCGSVLDAVAATRRLITLEPEQTALIDIVYGAAASREACLALVHKMMDRRLADRVFELAWTHSQVILRQLNASEIDAQTYARLANAIVYSQPTLARRWRDAAAQSARSVGAVGLRHLGRLADRAAADQRRQQHRPRAPDGAGARVVATQGPVGRPRDLERGARRVSPAAAGADPRPDIEQPRIARGRPTGRHLCAPGRTHRGRRSCAAAVGGARDRSATVAARSSSRQVVRRVVGRALPPPLEFTRAHETCLWGCRRTVDSSELLLFNGFGGFSPDGREYVIVN
jgi:cellobiose phosphorylase